MHFQPSQFKWTPNRKTLKKDEVPCVFDWSKSKEPRRCLIRQFKENVCDIEMPLDPPTPEHVENLDIELVPEAIAMNDQR